MQKESYRKMVLLGIKYAPTALALTCAVKICLLTQNDIEKNGWLWAVNGINLIANMTALLFFYCCGKYFGYCWKHSSLCRLAMWGYIYYGAFALLKSEHDLIEPITVFYALMVIVLTLCYKEL